MSFEHLILGPWSLLLFLKGELLYQGVFQIERHQEEVQLYKEWLCHLSLITK